MNRIRSRQMTSFHLCLNSDNNDMQRDRSVEGYRAGDTEVFPTHEDGFKEIFENSPIGMALLDMSGKYLDANEALVHLHGYKSKRDLIGKHFTQMLLPEDRNVAVSRWNEPPKAGINTGSMQLRLLHKDGHIMTCNVFGARIRALDGESSLVLAMVDDITELKMVDEEKNNFIATISHELRNPLAPIVSGAEFVRAALRARSLEQDPLLRSIDDVMAMIQNQAGNMSHLLNDLLDISRVNRGVIRLRKEKVNVVDVANSAANSVTSLMRERKHKLNMHLPKKAIYLTADPVRLEQIMVNLLNNAAKYTYPGGNIWFSVAHHGSDTHISVRDSGIGLDKDTIEQIMDPFTIYVRPHNGRRAGLGIGLKVTKELAALHGGKISVKSPGKGKGSEFAVDLPDTVA
jgi:PAS domain S-box-containing protein